MATQTEHQIKARHIGSKHHIARDCPVGASALRLPSSAMTEKLCDVMQCDMDIRNRCIAMGVVRRRHYAAFVLDQGLHLTTAIVRP